MSWKDVIEGKPGDKVLLNGNCFMDPLYLPALQM